MTLENKQVVILGGTSGIGQAVARDVARAGGVPLVVSHNPQNVRATLAQLPPNAQGHVADLRSAEQIRDLFTRIGPFDHLVYTAGETLLCGTLSDLTLDSARDFFEIRYWGALAAAKFAASAIRPGGSIVLTSGIAGARPPQQGWTLGASICAAMEGLTRALAVELAPLRVNIVSPGFVRTPLWRDMPDPQRQAMYQAAAQALPVGRIGEAADLAKAYLFLMEQGFSTGQVLVVDGGGMLV